MAKKIIIIIVFLSLVVTGIRLISGCGGGGGQGGTTVSTTSTTPSGTHGLTKIFFLHQSTGQGLITTGNMRETISTYNSTNGTNFGLWDFYSVDANNWPGLTDATGEGTKINIYDSYSLNGDTITYSQTDPESLYWTWTSTEDVWSYVRNQIMQFQVIAFKSCFGSAAIEDASALDTRKSWYLAMRDFFDQHPEKLFIVVTFPPNLPTSDTTVMQAYKNGRAFCNWISSEAYLSGHPNVKCFNLFDLFAWPDDGSADANTLKPEYRLSNPNDPHPNNTAYGIVGPKFADFLIQAALHY